MAGEFDGLAGQAELTELLDRCVEARRDLVLDLTETEFIDSLGLSLVASAHRHLCDAGLAVVVLGPCPKVARLLAVVGLAAWIPIASSREEAQALLMRPRRGATRS